MTSMYVPVTSWGQMGCVHRVFAPGVCVPHAVSRAHVATCKQVPAEYELSGACAHRLACMDAENMETHACYRPCLCVYVSTCVCFVHVMTYKICKAVCKMFLYIDDIHVHAQPMCITAHGNERAPRALAGLSAEYFCTWGTMYKPCARIATPCAE